MKNRFLILYKEVNLGVRRLLNFFYSLIVVGQLGGVLVVIYHATTLICTTATEINGEPLCYRELEYSEAVALGVAILVVPFMMYWGTIFLALWIREGFLLSKASSGKLS